MTSKIRIGKVSAWIVFAAALFATPSFAAIRVVTTIPDLAEVVRAIGGNEVEAESLLQGTENPHFADAKPSFILKASNADVVCLVGLELEIGWLPKVLSRSGNSRVQPGGAGYCETGKAVTVMDKPSGAVDRSMGDVHPAGNPHYYLSPARLSEAATVVAEALSRAKPEKSADFLARLKAFQSEMSKLLEDGKNKIKSKLKDPKTYPIIEYHKEFSYFLQDYGLTNAGTIEEKPGVPPSAGRIAQVAASAKTRGVKKAIATDYQPEGTLKKFSELSGVPTKTLPGGLQPGKEIKTIQELQNRLIDGIL